MLAREGRCGELEFEEACNQCHPDPPVTEQEAIRSVGSKGTLTIRFSAKSFLQTPFSPMAIIARHVTGK